jgi:hypothetical protein
VAEALNLFRDRDRCPGDPEVKWQWEQIVRNGTAPELPLSLPSGDENTLSLGI